MEHSKADDRTLMVSFVKTEERFYDIDFLYSQRKQIEASLAEVNGLIEQAEKLGIASAVKAEP